MLQLKYFYSISCRGLGNKSRFVQNGNILSFRTFDQTGGKDQLIQILIVEDEANISNLLKTHLEREGYRCSQAFTGTEALEKYFTIHPDLVILDLMLPGIDGLEVCRTIRSQQHDTYILMLTAKQEEIDRVLGLEMGADDYMIKPFSIRELLARVKVLLRRPHLGGDGGSDQSVIIRGDLELDPARMTVKSQGRPVNLTALEFDLLYFLMINAGIVFKRDQLLEKVWGEDPAGRGEVFDRNIDRIISQLRKKVERDPAAPEKILTIWGVGYKFNENS